jgi:hypothetical protein
MSDQVSGSSAGSAQDRSNSFVRPQETWSDTTTPSPTAEPDFLEHTRPKSWCDEVYDDDEPREWPTLNVSVKFLYDFLLCYNDRTLERQRVKEETAEQLYNETKDMWKPVDWNKGATIPPEELVSPFDSPLPRSHAEPQVAKRKAEDDLAMVAASADVENSEEPAPRRHRGPKTKRMKRN